MPRLALSRGTPACPVQAGLRDKFLGLTFRAASVPSYPCACWRGDGYGYDGDGDRRGCGRGVTRGGLPGVDDRSVLGLGGSARSGGWITAGSPACSTPTFVPVGWTCRFAAAAAAGRSPARPAW